MKKETISNIFSNFIKNEKILEIKNNNNGLINNTFVIYTNKNKYILQKISNIFIRENVCKNIKKIFFYFKKLEKENKLNKKYKILTPIFTKENKNYFIFEKDFYRVYKFIKNSITIENINLNNAKNIGEGIGNFYLCLKDFEDKLDIIIDNFHNIGFYFKKLQKLKENNQIIINEEIDNWIYSKKESQENFIKLLEESPKRVIHQDMKLSNILFDKNTKDFISIIDWDTIGKGSFLIDFGDMSRSFLKKMNYNLDIYFLFLDGLFGKIFNILTIKEKENLFLSIEMINLELAIRYYIDYLDENSKIFNLNKNELKQKILELYNTQNFLDKNKQKILNNIKQYGRKTKNLKTRR